MLFRPWPFWAFKYVVSLTLSILAFLHIYTSLYQNKVLTKLNMNYRLMKDQFSEIIVH